MRIIIDASVLCLRQYTRGGQQRYTRELLRHLDTADSGASYIVWFNFINPANLPLYEAARRELARTTLSYRTVRCPIPPQILEPLRVPVEVFTGAADVFHAPTTAAYSTRRARQVVTIHDLAYFDHPECFDFPDIEQCKRQVKRLASRAAMVLTVSEHARGIIIERLGVSPDNVRAIYHGVSPTFRQGADGVAWEAVRAQLGLAEPFILFLGTIQPNKNLTRLLDAFVELRRMGFTQYQLVLAGQRGWLADPILQHAARLGLGDRVAFTGHIADEALVTLYRHAELFVLASLCEGFGIPVIEAMSCGTPVVASNTGALPEVVGDAGLLVDPYSVKAIAQGMAEVLSSTDLRQHLVSRGARRAAGFTWERTAQETVAIYREVAAQ